MLITTLARCTYVRIILSWHVHVSFFTALCSCFFFRQFLHFLVSQLDEAAKNYRAVLELESGNVDAHFNLGVVLQVSPSPLFISLFVHHSRTENTLALQAITNTTNQIFVHAH